MEKEKKDFIIKRGVIGVGLPVAILMAVTAGFQVPGYLFRMQGFNFRTFFIFLVAFIPVFMAGGYLWGIFVYKYMHKKQ